MQGNSLWEIPIGIGFLVPAIILFISLTYVFFILLIFIREQIMKILYTQNTPQIGTFWIRGVSVATYILSCILLITQLEEMILYDGIFIIIYLASVLGNITSLWFISKQESAPE